MARLQRATERLAAAHTPSGEQLEGYLRQSVPMVTKRFKASLVVPGFVFMLTRAPVNLGKEMEPV